MQCQDAQELITALIDDEFSGADRAALEHHLEECRACQLGYRQEQDLKQRLRSTASRFQAPASLRAKVAHDLGLAPPVDAAPLWNRPLSVPSLLLRPALVTALLVLLVLPALYLMRPPGAPIPLMVAETYARIQRGQMQRVNHANPERLKEQLVQAVDAAFAPMGYDLSMMHLEPTGTVVRELGGRKVIVVVYQGKGPTVLCYTFLGTENEAPSSAGVFFDRDKNMRFYVFRIGTLNAVMHREGEVICILASPMPEAELLTLARAKARAS